MAKIERGEQTVQVDGVTLSLTLAEAEVLWIALDPGRICERYPDRFSKHGLDLDDAYVIANRIDEQLGAVIRGES